jgi:hypothetical protein
MAVEIIEVDSGPGLKDWVTFPNRLYRGDPRYVPQLIGQEVEFFTRAKNPSFKIAQTRLLAARRDGRLVGRVCGVIHDLEAGKLGYRRGRFGWFECAEDPEAAAALMQTPIAGDMTEREPHDGYLIFQGGVPEIQGFLGEAWK